MAKTTFIDKVTTIATEWLNEVNTSIFTAIGDGTNAPTTGAQVRTNIGAGTGDGNVVGPASSTDSGFAKFDGITGELLKNSAATIAVADGGTGATTASGARSNLSAASSGANSDITSLSGLTTPLSVAQGGTGRATSTTAYGLLAAGTTATGAHQTLSAGATTEILVGGGASALPIWTTAAGSGAPVRAGTPSFTTTIGVGAATASASGAGISFPATQSASTNANTLDDYEEGTFTPGVTFGTPGDLSVTYADRVSRYTKIGRLVACELYLQTSAFTHTTAAGNFIISGLPFTSGTVTSSGVKVNRATGWTLANNASPSIQINASSTNCNSFVSTTGGGDVTMDVTHWPTGTTVLLSSSLSYSI